MRSHGPKRSTVERTALAALLALSAAPASAQTPTFAVPGFTTDVIHSGNGMTAFAFGPGGRLYVAEKRGQVLYFAPNGSGGFQSPVVFADIRSAVDVNQESGLLGLALDPSFATSRAMYLFYTTRTDQRLVRLTADAGYTAAEAGSEVVVLSGLPRSVNFHRGGDLQFHPNDPAAIFISLGDDNDPSTVASPTTYPGKILRVNKADGRGLPDNPFQDGNMDSVRSRVWSVGHRNPFRFTFHPNAPVADVAYVSENGNSTDKVAWVRRGSNGGWGTGGDGGGFLSPPDTNHRVLLTDSASHVGVAVTRGGPFGDPANPNADVLYIANWLGPSTGGSIRRFRLTGAELDAAVPIAADGGQRFVRGMTAVHLAFGPDGALYCTNTTVNESLGAFYNLVRIRAVGGAAPVASFITAPSPATGPAPLSVAFTDTSVDPDGTIASRAWTFGDGQTSSVANPTHVYATPGTYTATLLVRDNSGQTATAMRAVTPYRGVALRLRGRVVDGRNLLGNAVGTVLRVYMADGSTPLPFAGGGGAGGNEIIVPGSGTFDESIAVQLSGGAVVVSAGEGSVFRPAYAGFVVPAGAASFDQTFAFYLSDTALRGRITDTRGDPAMVDVGVARASAAALYTVAGGRDYLAASGIPASGVLHRVVSDATGRYYVPLRSADAGVAFLLDAVADTGADTYAAATASQVVAAGAVVVRDVRLGLLAGGMGCDDVSAVPAPSGVDYASQIQPLWTSQCTGCHNAGSGNGAGLNLLTSSHANLVGAPSTEVPGRQLVVPGDPAASYLFEKLNCANPQIGTRMRPASPMSASDQALVRAWILQGALAAPGSPDAGVRDASPPDARAPDASTPDARAGDAGPADAPAQDATIADATPDTDATRADGQLATDAAPTDALTADGGPPDALTPDGAPDDALASDGAPSDAQVEDGALADALGAPTDAGDGAPADAAEGAPADAQARVVEATRGGCGCAAAHPAARTRPAWALLTLVLALCRRRARAQAARSRERPTTMETIDE